MLPVGAVVAGYRIERKLGAGGMGTVYLAQNPVLPRLDALKVLSAELSRDHEFRARFAREADVAARLDHPNIVSIYRRGETESGQLWIAMSYIDGTDADAAQKAGTMTPLRAVHVIGEIAKALDYAHRLNFVHRDVKPANFLLSSATGGTERVLLGDFGIARALDDVGLTAAGSLMATVPYAAPEVLSGGRFDHRADLYSLGCSLFRLLTGTPPFSGAAGVPALMLAHLQEPPPRVSERAPGLSPALDAVVATAMAKDPDRRFQTAGQLAAAASAALEHTDSPETGRGQTVPAATPWWESSGQQRTMMAPYGVSPQPVAPLVDPLWARRRRRRWIVSALGLAVAVSIAGVSAALLNSRNVRPIASSPTTTAAPLPATALGGLLVSSTDINEIMGATLNPDPAEEGMSSYSDSLTPKECAEAYTARQRIAYEGSGWQSSVGQGFREPSTDPSQLIRIVEQVVVSFPSAALAESFVDGQKSQWAGCGKQELTIMSGKTPILFTFSGSDTDSDGITTITATPRDGGDWKCAHALAARNNIVIDTDVCSFDNQRAATIAIVNNIAAKVKAFD